MIRRGIPFGMVMPEGDAGAEAEERGLHFVCFIADLARQFEFVQHNWLNSADFPNGQVVTPGQSSQPTTTAPAAAPAPIGGRPAAWSPRVGGVRAAPGDSAAVTLQELE